VVIEPQALEMKVILVNLHNETIDNLKDHKPLEMKVILVNLHDVTKDNLKDHKPKTVFEVSCDKVTMVDMKRLIDCLFMYTPLEMKVILVNLQDETKDNLKDHKPEKNTMLSYIGQ
jgi:hypothetical protein